MIIREVGFRPLYHMVCAFELNDRLKEIIKDCPEVQKASHAVVYGYIDPKEGLMLEILGAGKQAPKYFYFKEPYEGERITIRASEVEDVEFMYFPELEPRFRKKFDQRIAELAKYDAAEELEDTRKLEFLDPLRSPQYPDDVRVVLMKDGLKTEEVWVHMTHLGDHVLVGTLLNQPYQDYGVNKGDSLEFHATETDDKEILCYKDFDEPYELSREERPIALYVGKMDVFNYALYENDVAPIRGITIINHTKDPVDGLTIRITSDFPFFQKYEKLLPRIPSGKPIDLPDPHFIINGRELAEMTETVHTEILVELCKEGEMICGVRGKMQVLAYDQWQGGETYRDLLPAFVLPNHPVIPALMHDAADRLAKWKKSASLEGYQSNDPNRVRDFAAAAYAAIQKKNIVYAKPPASFSVVGQRIRTPEIIMEQRLGTCMDMTLLYTALLEAMGLHPILVMQRHHIFAGVWLKERTYEERKTCDVVIDNRKQLTMRIDNGSDEMTFVECTAMCFGENISFEEAEARAKQNILDSEEFQFAIDVASARMHGIKPVPSRVKDGGGYQIEVNEKEDDELTDAPANLGITIADAATAKPRKISGKRELWESKLLDLSTRNMLLNVPLNASIEPIMSSHIDELEDALSDGHEFNLLPAADWIVGLSYREVDANGNEGKEIQWLPEAMKQYGIFEMTEWPASADFDFNEKLRQEYHNHRLYTYCSEKQLDRELTGIYRAARASQQENGVSSLYLAIGLLRWFVDPEAEIPCYAPLILVPIEIVRTSANQGYALHARDEDSHFNTTLLEMLKQNFNIEVGGLEPLPVDEHGLDVKKIFSLVRSAVFSVKNWDVVETCVIGNFSFAQFAMWNDIHTAGDVLDNSKMVRSLRKGYVDWEAAEAGDLEEDRVYLPITVDATQLKAIKMAAHGMTFVLHGPPGTGKSQTITGMIANLMAQGKKVLFVAEKMAALSVVQKRLASLGIGAFCLELHSDKASKKQVLTQLDRALAIKSLSKKTEYEELLQETEESRKKLDGYAYHLHAVQKCGMSLRELIALYETVREERKYVCFDCSEAGKLTKDEIRSHIPLIGELTATGEAVGDISGSPLIGVGITSYGAELRSQLKNVAERYLDAIGTAHDIGKTVAEIMKVTAPESKEDLLALDQLTAMYFDKKGTEPLILTFLHYGTEEAYAYFEKQEAVSNEKTYLLQDWNEDFLTRDMKTYLAKYEAAGKKFFGKSGAMAAVVAEIQDFTNKTISYGQIPELLKPVIEYQKKNAELEKAREGLSESAKALLKKFPGRAEFDRAYASAMECREQASRFPGGIDAIIELSQNADNGRVLAQFHSDTERLLEAESRLNELLMREENTNAGKWFEEETKFCQYLLENLATLKDWALYNQVRQECMKAGLKPVVEAYESDIKADELIGAYKKGFYYALINFVISSDDILSSFSGAAFNEAIEQFKKLDDAVLEQTKKEIYHILASRVPTSWDSPEIGMELNLLRKAIGSNARGMSIRTLFERIPNVLQELCPCMLMSPNSVAQYLAQDNNLFDVVIFDEASQLPTCKAVGALFRAKDAVIVGDPKQMPPTSFFAGSGPEVDDFALDDLDSILDDALALGIPSQHLQWHYRSTHESLIAFSNHQFYENKMYTFPSANDRERHVTAVHAAGVYSKGTNIKEAEAVVGEIIRRFNDPILQNQSIGVVTFNVKQQILIENLLAKQFQNNAKLDAWANSGDDPLFVKNLENVQGDERDVILFSIGYGPDERGHVSNNFGPINKAGGGKRLNVAFSRARITMTIFTSIYSSDIKVTETSPEGLIAFHDFLQYAEGHDIHTESSAETKAKLEKAGILQNICKAVREHGFQCETMIGHSDFHVDIAVVDPYEPAKYMLGILLDGDGYRQTKNTRDREVAQIGVLKHLGWNLCRVWTIDWWDNREKELYKLFAKLDQLKAESEADHETLKAEEVDRKAEEAVHAAETARVKVELESQAAEVVAEDEEADKDKRIVSVPFAGNAERIVTASSEVEETKQEEKESEESEDLLAGLVQNLIEANGKIVDKRSNGGALWVIGGKNLAPVMKKFKEQGIKFIFKAGGGKSTGGKDGWWAKTDVQLPIPEVKKTIVKTVVESAPAETATLMSEVEKKEETVVPVSEVEKKEETEISVPVEYVSAEILVGKVSSVAEFVATSKRKEIAQVINEIVSTEAPILKDTLMRKTFSAFGVTKTSATLEAFEKALKIADTKNVKNKGIVFCWKKDQDTNGYTGIRISNERSGEEIAPQEIRNAMCYVLKEKGTLEKGDLLKETSLVFGYKRLGKNLEAALIAGLTWAKLVKAVIAVGGNQFELPDENV